MKVELHHGRLPGGAPYFGDIYSYRHSPRYYVLEAGAASLCCQWASKDSSTQASAKAPAAPSRVLEARRIVFLVL